MFSESALDEIMFVQRAKGIGMSLEDIADLVAAWPTGKCQSLQARLRAYVAGRISEVHKQQAELSAFEHQLQTVLSRLSAHDSQPAMTPGQQSHMINHHQMTANRPSPAVVPSRR